MNAPDPFAIGGRQDDPLVELWSEHVRIRAERELLPDSDEGDDECDRLGGELTRIEDEMDAIVPTTLDGLIALLRLMLFYDEIGLCGEGDALKNILAGAERLSRAT